MKPVHLVAAKRSPIGRFGGGLKSLSAADLALAVAEAVVPELLRSEVGQVILGQVLQAGCGMNVARQVGWKLGLPEATPAYTVNMACGSSLKAVALGADAIRLGENELVLAGGVEVMSRAPHYAMDSRWGKKLGNITLQDSLFLDGLSDAMLDIGMGETAERIADHLGITRVEQDAFASRSQQLAATHRAIFERDVLLPPQDQQTPATRRHWQSIPEHNATASRRAFRRAASECRLPHNAAPSEADFHRELPR